MTLSEKILLLRRQSGLSQEDLAEQLNVSRQAISRWENGSAQPDASNLWQISRFFAVSADDLLNDAVRLPKDIRSSDENPTNEHSCDLPKSSSPAKRHMHSMWIAALFFLGGAGYLVIRLASRFLPYFAYRIGVKDYQLFSQICNLVGKILLLVILLTAGIVLLRKAGKQTK